MVLENGVFGPKTEPHYRQEKNHGISISLSLVNFPNHNDECMSRWHVSLRPSSLCPASSLITEP